jgi:hypothetical protein
MFYGGVIRARLDPWATGIFRIADKESIEMASRVGHKKRHSAIKHGGYSALGLLPGESSAEFEQLHKDLVEELAPRRPLEEDIVSTLARLLWRKQNRSTFRIAASVRARCGEILEVEMARRNITTSFPMVPFEQESDETQAARRDAERFANEQAQRELGDLYDLTKCNAATDAHLLADLAVEERLDAVIDKCIKRLLMVRGVKSMAIQVPSETPQQPKPRSIAGSTK